MQSSVVYTSVPYYKDGTYIYYNTDGGGSSMFAIVVENESIKTIQGNQNNLFFATLENGDLKVRQNATSNYQTFKWIYF